MTNNSNEIKPIPLSEWHAKARELFGEKARYWRFICPACKTVQTGKQFMDAGCSEEEAKNSIAVECIGRWLSKEKSQKAFGEKKRIQGKPCDYAGYGLFKLNPVPVLFDDGKIFHVFAFDE